MLEKKSGVVFRETAMEVGEDLAGRRALVRKSPKTVWDLREWGKKSLETTLGGVGDQWGG